MKKKYSKVYNRIISVVLSVCMVSGFWGVKIDTYAAELTTKSYSSGQINWTANGLEVYDDDVNNLLETIADTENTNLVISGSARVNVQSGASGSTLGGLSISGTGSYFHVQNGANVEVVTINNGSTGGSFGRGLSVEGGGTLSCASLSNTSIAQVNGTFNCSGSFTNNGSFYDIGSCSFTGTVTNSSGKTFSVDAGKTLSCGSFYNYGSFTEDGTLTTGSFFNENSATITAGSASSITCSSYNAYADSTFSTDGYFKCTGTLNNQSSATFTSGNASTLVCKTIDNYGAFTNNGTTTVETITGKITVNGRNSGTATVNCSGTITNSGGVNVYAGTLTCNNFTGSGAVDVNSGSIFTITNTYDCTGKTEFLNSTVNAGTFISPTSGYNAGTGELAASNITWKNGFSNATTVKATSSLTFTGYDPDVTTSIGAAFTADENTVVNSDGAYFTLKSGSKTKNIEGELITDKKASWVVKAEPTVTIGISFYDNYYYGINYNYSSKVSTTSDGTPQVTYKTATDDWGNVVTGNAYTATPTKVGTYVMYVNVPETTDYRGVEGQQAFRIKGISMGSMYCTIEQTQSAPDYYNTPVTLVAPDGYLISPDDGETVPFASKYTLTEDGWYYGVSGVYQEIDTGGKTDPSSNHGLYDGAFYIDQTPPEILQDTAVDQDDNAVTKTIENGVVIKARSVSFTVKDEIEDYARTLKSVTVDGTSIEVDSDMGTADVYLSILYPGTKTHRIVAEDVAGNKSEWNVTLEYLPTAIPETPYTLSGTKGKNGYYISDVELIPADGFSITSDVNSEPSAKLTYTSGLENVYLIRGTDGAFTSPIPVEKLLVDKAKPTIPKTVTNQDGIAIDLEDGGEVHARKIDFSVSDTNLTSVTLNGEEIEVVDGKADISIIADRNEIRTYKVKAEDIAGNTSEVVFSLKYSLKPLPDATLSIGDTIVGTDYSIILETNSDGKNEAELYYKAEGEDDSAYTKTKPSTAGKYVVQARIPETETYEGTKCEDTFNLSYLKAPETPYIISGKKGNNKYYVADVYLNAPDGYSISTSAGGKFTESVLYSDKLSSIYLKRSDGALTDAIDVKENLKIDKTTPSFSQSTGSVYADELTVEISDDHLSTFVIDGETFKVTKTSTTAKLDPLNGVKTFNLSAEDEAGNSNDVAITVMATWLKNKVIPAGKLLPLDSSESYKLGSGKWTVSGDSTIYTGGGSVYVNKDGDYTFTQID